MQEMESKISLVQDIANNIYENFSIYFLEQNNGLTYRLAVEGNQWGDVYHIQMELCKQELIRHAKLRLILQGIDMQNQDKKEFLIHVKEYATDLICKYKQIKKETDEESNNNPQKFLGCIKVDAKLIYQLIIGIFIGIVGSFGQILLQSLYEQ
ncbi:hypothetical protein PPERSA_05434 [Pseudocohnilembus persalinus]|uniref:Transmembrane protein n=1 Tax=Pseudocohnilembus persalinus TaxID=266149 RepID=A0A0V0R804_PSEPJ|nr:hypothetical protein PPERSA_05434 [Pseudocohnilembus persalinus]|eukprot:KRX10614.1 hypothetical protein PPERSA_05434 [Pseudocohnilembus persalinus]